MQGFGSRRWSKSCLVLLMVPALACFAGCKSGGEKKTEGESRAGKAVSGLTETRAELATGKQQIDRTLVAMNAMRDGQGPLPTEFAAFNAELKRTETLFFRANPSMNCRVSVSVWYMKFIGDSGKITVVGGRLSVVSFCRANSARRTCVCRKACHFS